MTQQLNGRKPPTQASAQPQVPAQQNHVAAQICQKCEKPLRDGVKFCSSCGFCVAGTQQEQPSRFCNGCADGMLHTDTHCSSCGRKKQNDDDTPWEGKIDQQELHKRLGALELVAEKVDFTYLWKDAPWCFLELWGIICVKYFVELMSMPELCDLFLSFTPGSLTQSFFRYATSIKGYPHDEKNLLPETITHTAMLKWLYVYGVQQEIIYEDGSFSSLALAYFKHKWHTPDEDLAILQVTVNFSDYSRDILESNSNHFSFYNPPPFCAQTSLSFLVKKYGRIEQDTLSWWEQCKPRQAEETNETKHEPNPTAKHTIQSPNYCSQCAHPAAPGAKYCATCHALLVRSFLRELDTQKITLPTHSQFINVPYQNGEHRLMAFGFCPQCSSQVYLLDHGAHYCEICAAPLYPHSECQCLPTHDLYQFEYFCAHITGHFQVCSFCANCSCPVFPAQRFCIRCGTKLPDMLVSVQKKPPSLVACACGQLVYHPFPLSYQCEKGHKAQAGKGYCNQDGTAIHGIPHVHYCCCGEPLPKEMQEMNETYQYETVRPSTWYERCCEGCGARLADLYTLSNFSSAPLPTLRQCSYCGTKTWSSWCYSCGKCSAVLPLTRVWLAYIACRYPSWLSILHKDSIGQLICYRCDCGYTMWQPYEGRHGYQSCRRCHRAIYSFHFYYPSANVLPVAYVLPPMQESLNAGEVEGTLTYIDNRTEQPAQPLSSSSLPLCKQCGRVPVRHQGTAFCASCLEKPWPEYPNVQRA